MSDAALQKGTPLDLLVLKLEAWMTQQPEWLMIVALPRPQRRAAMKELAGRLYTIPIMDGANTVPRQVRRKTAKQLGNQAQDQAREEVLGAIAARREELLEAAAIESELLGEMARAQLLEEGVASVALDEETQAVESEESPEPDPEGNVQGGQEGTGATVPAFDPEGEVKAQLYSEEAPGDNENVITELLVEETTEEGGRGVSLRDAQIETKIAESESG